jgi:hypothetical protein
VEGVGGKLPSQNTQLPPPKGKRKKGKEKKEREKERKGEGGEYMYTCILFFGANPKLSNPLVKLFLRALDKTTEYPQST